MPVVKLTARGVAALPIPPSGRVEYFDSTLPGFYIRVAASGVKSYGVFYRAGGRLSRHTIGRTPPLELADARDFADELLSKVKLGANPQAEKIAARRALAFGDLAGRFIAARRPNLAPSTAVEYERLATKYLAPLARIPGAELRRSDVRELLERIAESSGPVQSNRVFQFVRAVCRWAVREDYLDTSPVEAMQRPRKESSRERVLSDDEIRALWMGTAKETAGVRAFVRALLLLGQRRGETLTMRWQDLDLAAKIPLWTIPGSHRKGGRVHAVPLPPAMKEIIEGLPRKGERVFGMGDWNILRWWTPLRERAMRAAGSVEPYTMHDLRRTVRTGLSRLGVASETAERVIGHKAVGLAAVYDVYDRLPEKASALSAWAAHVAQVLQQPASKTKPAKVLPMKRRA
jgi:integrase